MHRLTTGLAAVLLILIATHCLAPTAQNEFKDTFYAASDSDNDKANPTPPSLPPQRIPRPGDGTKKS